MIESILGTSCLCCILIVILLIGMQFLAIKFKFKFIEAEVSYWLDYGISFIVFFTVAAILLLLYMFYYYQYRPDLPLVESGLLFQMLGFVVNIIIKAIYRFLIWSSTVVFKAKTKYLFKVYEMNWTIIFICITYTIYFILIENYLYAFSYLVLSLGYFFGLFTSKDNFTFIVKELKDLTLLYWFCVIFTVICGFASIRYPQPPYNIASVVGIIFGFLFGIIAMVLLNVFYYNPSISSGNRGAS